MNAVVSLCHFCELHGPSVLISAQPCRSHSTNFSEGQKFYGPQESLQSTGFANTLSCEVLNKLFTEYTVFMSLVILICFTFGFRLANP